MDKRKFNKRPSKWGEPKQAHSISVTETAYQFYLENGGPELLEKLARGFIRLDRTDENKSTAYLDKVRLEQERERRLAKREEIESDLVKLEKMLKLDD